MIQNAHILHPYCKPWFACSRNARLTFEARQAALCIPRALKVSMSMGAFIFFICLVFRLCGICFLQIPVSCTCVCVLVMCSHMCGMKWWVWCSKGSWDYHPYFLVLQPSSSLPKIPRLLCWSAKMFFSSILLVLYSASLMLPALAMFAVGQVCSWRGARSYTIWNNGPHCGDDQRGWRSCGLCWGARQFEELAPPASQHSPGLLQLPCMSTCRQPFARSWLAACLQPNYMQTAWLGLASNHQPLCAKAFVDCMPLLTFRLVPSTQTCICFENSRPSCTMVEMMINCLSSSIDDHSVCFPPSRGVSTCACKPDTRISTFCLKTVFGIVTWAAQPRPTDSSQLIQVELSSFALPVLPYTTTL